MKETLSYLGVQGGGGREEMSLPECVDLGLGNLPIVEHGNNNKIDLNSVGIGLNHNIM